jgi:hypothetical protein
MKDKKKSGVVKRALKEIENDIRYPPGAVALKRLAMLCEARLRGLERMESTKTIRALLFGCERGLLTRLMILFSSWLLPSDF